MSQYDNIKVCCRFRPRNPREIKEEGGKNTKFVNFEGNTVVLQKDKKLKFPFDHVFPENSTQEDVFTYVGAPMVEEMMKGYNCTIFAYGMTSAGKTYSMTGEPGCEGIIPRLVKKLFDRIASAGSEKEYTIAISFVEIYLEKIRDLLDPREENLRIREGGFREGIWIQGVTEEYAGSYEDVLTIMKEGNTNRSVAETKMNQRSSRSHSVFLLTLTQTRVATSAKKSSTLILVDLAGSEKVKKTGASGLTLLQAQHTNKSLTALGMVIKSLTDNATHVPYRNSKLTRILTDSLGGNSKTCLLIACSPSSFNLEETLSTLRFGARVKTIKNKPRVNEEKSIEEYKRLLKEARERIHELEKGVKGIDGSKRRTSSSICIGTDMSGEDLHRELAEKIYEVEKLEELILEKDRVIEEKEQEYNASLAEKQIEIDDLTDEFQEKLAQKEDEFEKQVQELSRKLGQKEYELKAKINENENLKLKYLSESTPRARASSTESGRSKVYFEKMLESRNELVSVLETALAKSEQTARDLKKEHSKTVREMKRQIEDLQSVLYKPTVSKAVRNIMIPVKKKSSLKFKAV